MQTTVAAIGLFVALLFSAPAAAQTPLGTDTIPDFVPIPNRWRDILPPPSEYNVDGHAFDPYNQNWAKGDYPIIGQNTFLVFTGRTRTFAEAFRTPTPSGVSAQQAGSATFFGNGDQFQVKNDARITLEFYHGDVAFRPRDWELRASAVFDVNYVNTRERRTVDVNVRDGNDRRDEHVAFEELSFEKHLFDISDRYDFVSARAGIQQFASDFRGFVFTDNNLGARLFGNAANGKFQYNAIFLDMLEKDTNSELNTVFERRDQQVGIVNAYRQDLGRMGYTAQVSFHYVHDRPTTRFDDNGFQVRPAVIDIPRPHDIEAFYLGWTGDGHLGRLNVAHAAYQVLGTDDYNPLAGRAIDINAQMGALELSIDDDWRRYTASIFYASGDDKPFDGTGRGFDSIIDRPVFAGGASSYWNSQELRLANVALVQKQSLIPSLRSDKFEGQPNYVNPGIIIYTAAYEAALTPKLEMSAHASHLRFAYAASLENFLNQPNIGNNIGIDAGIGIRYRPLLNNNVIFTLSTSGLMPLRGFSDIYETNTPQYAFSSSMTLTY